MTQKQPTKAAMIKFINGNSKVKASSSMKMEDIVVMYNVLMTDIANKALEKMAPTAAPAPEQAPLPEAPPVDEAPVKKDPNRIVNVPASEIKAHIKRVADPLRDEINRLKAELAARDAAPVVVPEPAVPAARTNYIDAKIAYDAAFEAYMTALRGGQYNKDLFDAYNAAATVVKNMERDMSIREHIVDFLEGTADVTREYGHRGVNAVAKVMHMGVDGVANAIDASAKLVARTGVKRKAVIVKPEPRIQ